MSKLIIVGESPGKTAIPLGQEQMSLTEGAGRNLAEIAGWEWRDYLHWTIRRNLFYLPTPPEIWAPQVARFSAMILLREWTGKGIPMIVLGSKVKEAFEAGTRETIPTYEFKTIGAVYETFGGEIDVSIRVAHVPHPSGRNRYWNTAHNRDQARLFLHHLLD